MIYYYDSNGRQYPGKIHVCAICKREKIVRACKIHILCRKCSYGRRKTDVKNNELYIEAKRGDSTIRIRTEKAKCSICSREYLRRKNHRCTTDICNQCICAHNGHLSYKNGIGNYPEKAINEYGKLCSICLSFKNICVHHIDGNRINNIITNLITLCTSCHRAIHWKIKKGMSFQEALNYISNQN